MKFRHLLSVLVVWLVSVCVGHAQGNRNSALNFERQAMAFLKTYQADSVLNLVQTTGLYTLSELTVSKEDKVDQSSLTLDARNCIYISKSYRILDDFSNAEAYAQTALDFALAAYGVNSSLLFPYYLQIGELYLLLEENSGAEDYFRKAIYVFKKDELYSNTIADESIVLADVYTKIGHAKAGAGWGDLYGAIEQFRISNTMIAGQEQGIRLRIENLATTAYLQLRIRKSKEALENLYLAEELWQSVRSQYADDTKFQRLAADINFHIGYYYKGRGDYINATKFMREAIMIDEAYPDPYLPISGLYPLMHISEIYGIWSRAHQGEEFHAKLDSSIFFTQKALHKVCKEHKSFDISDIPETDDLSNHQYVYGILCQLGRFNEKKYLRLNDTLKLLEAYRIGSALVQRLDEKHYENIKEALSQRNGKYVTLMNHSEHFYNYGLHFAHSSNKIKESPSNLEKGFYYMQKSKAQQLWASFLKDEGYFKASVPDSLLIKEKEIEERILSLEAELINAEKRGDTEVIDLVRNTQLFEERRTYTKFQKHIEKNYPVYIEERYNFKPESIEFVQSCLREDEILIDYNLAAENGNFFCLEKDKPIRIYSTDRKKFDNAPVIKKELPEFCKLLRNSPLRRPESREKFISMSARLYDFFIRPFEKQIKDKKRLIIIGNEATFYLPFEVLLSDNASKPLSELPYLVKDYEVVYHYSANLWAKARKQAVEYEEENIYAFAPVYDVSEEPQTTSQKTVVVAPNLRAVGENGDFLPLPESEREVKEIIEKFDKNIGVHNAYSLRQEATEKVLKQRLEENFKYVHIAGHSFANLQYDKFSGIACTRDTEGEEDGILYVGEIYNLETKADLITLSSCESGLGKLSQSDGLLGLNRAFLHSGTPNVIFSLWKVYDNISAELMVNFYNSVLQEQEYSTALRKAKLDFIENDITAAPFFWSPFLLIGK